MGKLDYSLKVLVVDDMMSMRNIVKRSLVEIGYQDIHFATNGEEALEKLKAGEFGFVLLDWNMPIMSGIEVLRTMRANPALQKIPVLMITAEAQMENIMEAVQAGVSEYLVKPFSGQALQEKLEKVFDKLPKGNA